MTGGAGADENLPLIVAIHGLGDSPRGFAGLMRGMQARARVMLPAGPDPYLDGYAWFPFTRGGRNETQLAEGIRAAAQRVVAFLSWAERARPSRGRPIVTGFSQGGMISFAIAVLHPAAVAAALPVGGWLPPPLWPQGLPPSPPPIIAFHGQSDAVVPYAPTERSVEHLRGLGFAIELHAYPDVAHAIPTGMRGDLHAALAEQLLQSETKAPRL